MRGKGELPWTVSEAGALLDISLLFCFTLDNTVAGPHLNACIRPQRLRKEGHHAVEVYGSHHLIGFDMGGSHHHPGLNMRIV